jgi:putative ABC transport system permease protein
MRSIVRDLFDAARALRRSPASSFLVVAVLALAIGATATLWTAVEAVVLRPLPFPAPERLVVVADLRDGERWTTSPSNFTDYRREVPSLNALAAYGEGSYALVDGEGPAEQIPGAEVTADFFAALGARATLGRTLGAADDDQPVVVLGETLWRRRFAGDPEIVGQVIRVDGAARTVVGILAAESTYPLGAELWVPLAFSEEVVSTQRGAHWLRTVGRLAPGTDLARANAELAAVGNRLAGEYPRTNEGMSAIADLLHERLVRHARPTLWLLLGAVALALLAACANLASLTLARALARAPELALRASLGGSPARLGRSLLAECLLLGLAGAALGSVLAIAALEAMPRWAGEMPRLAGARFDAGTAIAAGLLAGLCGLLLGIAPAAFALRRDPAEALRAAGRSVAGARGAGRVRSALVVATTLMALILVAGAVLLERSYRRLSEVQLGFEPTGRLAFSLALPDSAYPRPEDNARFTDDLLARVRRLPGVESAGATFGQPLGNFRFSMSIRQLDGRELAEDADQPSMQIRIVSADYLATLGVPLRAGRAFGAADRHGAPSVVIVSESAARRLLAGADPLGHTLEISSDMRLGRGRLAGEIVGVVGDVRDRSPAEDAQPTVYFVHDQYPVGFLTFVVAADVARLSGLVAPIRDAVAALDAELPIFRLRTFEQLLADVLAAQRLLARLLSGFALAAALFAALGLFGVLQQTVAERRRELAIRSALGAEPAAIQRDLLGRALALTGAGIALGLAAALPLSRFLRGLLYELSPTDPATLAAASGVLFATALAAAWAPARRAGRIDPLTALREE